MTTATISAIQQYIEAINAHDIERIVATHTADVVLEAVAPPEGVFRGEAGLRQFWQEHFTAVPDLHFDFGTPLGPGDGVTVEWTASGMMQRSSEMPDLPEAGKAFRARGVTVYEMAGGKIRREREYMDTITMLRQLGVVPEQWPG